ncbi:GNAT family N-acetyltransferase [Orenia marismortui]|uniref:RimJ/RimL family protein N-acetyltransferase n=1 Tax=Orenia marismortui TaxID=46469 RepID=A0A4R8GL99_9FIRM|nr:GNAT family N-acetyltransferase [Orenia marismortui]TDX46335.1 RimJ/RimL family protein N-acetyltransferase [Orenia marismortui]
MIIREIQKKDAEDFLELCKKLDRETEFLLLEPGERNLTVAEQKRKIINIQDARNKNIFLVEDEGSLIAYLGAYGGEFKRNFNTIYIVVAVLEDYTGQGIGSRLFHHLEQWGQEEEFHRFELTVMSHNNRAINLYKKMGFEIEGLRKDALFISGKYIDEYYMSKLI